LDSNFNRNKDDQNKKDNVDKKTRKLLEIKFVEWFVNIVVDKGSGNSWPQYLLTKEVGHSLYP
jgi:hypothetical protein